MSKNQLLIRGGRVVDPATGRDEIGDVLIEGKRIVDVGSCCSPSTSDVDVLDATGLLVTPGLIDMHAHLREPGNAEVETILTGARAAVAGGITTVACFPNTEPAIDNEASAEFVVLQGKRAGYANVFPIGAVTVGRAGERLVSEEQWNDYFEAVEPRYPLWSKPAGLYCHQRAAPERHVE